jgi:hypothetical protein
MDMETVLARLADLRGDLAICTSAGVVTRASQVVPVDEETQTPPAGTGYLLEVELAPEVPRVWRDWRGGAEPDRDEAYSEAIHHYADRDAYLPVGGVPEA